MKLIRKAGSPHYFPLDYFISDLNLICLINSRRPLGGLSFRTGKADWLLFKQDDMKWVGYLTSPFVTTQHALFSFLSHLITNIERRFPCIVNKPDSDRNGIQLKYSQPDTPWSKPQQLFLTLHASSSSLLLPMTLQFSMFLAPPYSCFF